MKTIKTKLILLFITTILSSIACKKENETIRKETPLKTTIHQGVVVDTSFLQPVVASTTYELGYLFESSKQGKITKLGCKMPEAGSYTVSLWDYSTESLITSTVVTITNTTTDYVYNSISAVSITPDKEYVISINNVVDGSPKKYFVYIKRSNTSYSSIYPFTIGSITYNAQISKLSSTSVFPNIIDDEEHHALIAEPDFVFEY